MSRLPAARRRDTGPRSLSAPWRPAILLALTLAICAAAAAADAVAPNGPEDAEAVGGAGLDLEAPAAGGDFDPHTPGWNALHYLRATAREADVQLEVTPALDFGALRGDEILLVVAPLVALDAGAQRQLTRFVEAGGRLVVADDFRAGASWMRPFGLVLRPEAGAPPAVADGLPGLAAFDGASIGGLLGYQVAQLVLNHPASIRVDASAAAADRAAGRPGGRRGPQRVAHGRYLDGVRAFLVEVRLGRGRLLALADPSVLIDGMLRAYHGDKQFAANLLRWGCFRGEPCRVRLLANLKDVHGTFTAADAGAHGTRAHGMLELFAAGLRSLAATLRDPWARPLGWAVALLALLLPAWRAARLPRPRLPQVHAGQAGRGRLAETVEAWLLRPDADFRQPARLLAQRLGRRVEAACQDVAAAAGGAVIAAAATEGTAQRPAEREPGVEATWRRLRPQVQRLISDGRLSPSAVRRLDEIVAALSEVARAEAQVDRGRFAQLASEVEWAEHVLSHTRGAPRKRSGTHPLANGGQGATLTRSDGPIGVDADGAADLGGPR